jgi:hypothetical protein
MKILFISEFQANTLYTHSTNIVVYNLLKAFNGTKIDFSSILLYDFDQSIENIKSSLIEEGISVKSTNFIETIHPIRMKKSILHRYLEFFKKAFIPNYYKKYINKISFHNNHFDLVITHSPSIDSVALLKTLIKNKKISYNKYFQLWSDPIAAAGVNYKKLKFQRKILKSIEINLHSIADRIYFFTETLFLSQKEIFNNPKFHKLDLFYDTKNSSHFVNFDYTLLKQPINALYFGDFSLKTRDLRPLYKFISSSDKNKLTIIGESRDLLLKNNSNVKIINQRFPKDALYSQILRHNLIIAVLNKYTIQIPGKVFFDSNIPYPFLILLDGPFKMEILNYLRPFNRFIFVENNHDSIKLFFDNFNFIKDTFNPSLIPSSKFIVDKLLNDYSL